MALKSADVETELIDAVCARIRERLPEDQAAQCMSFVRQYYHWVPAEDLADRDPLDLYGAAVAHWNQLQQRARRARRRCTSTTPTSSRTAGHSSHTVVELVTATCRSSSIR